MSATIDKSQKVAHDNKALSTVTEKANCIVHSWPRGCKAVYYRPNKFGQQTVARYFCRTGGREETKVLTAELKK